MRILGLDLGSSSIKAVEVDASFGRYEIREYYETPVQPGQKPSDAAALLIRSLRKAPDRIAVSLPGNFVTQRTLRVPTRDKKAIKAAVNFELEDDLPFDIENACYDYSILSHDSQGSRMHIAVSLQKHASAFLAQLQQAGVDPDLVTTESWAFRTYLNRVVAPASQDTPLMLVHIGANSTSIYVQHEGAPLFQQILQWGGNDLTFAIASEFEMTPAEAEKAKCERGLMVPGAEATQGERIECKGQIVAVLNKLLLELRQALLSCKSFTQKLPKEIYFCGGGSLVAGLPDLLIPELKIKIKPLQALSAVSLSGVAYSEQADATFLLSAALAFCLVGPDRNTSISFRKGALSKSGGSTGFDFQMFKGPALAGGIIATCLIGSLITESIVYKKKLKKEDAALERSMKNFFPTLSSSSASTYLRSPSKLKEAIDKELATQKVASLLYGPNPHSPMVLLKTLSKNISNSIVVDMIRFQAGSASDAPFKSDASTDASLTFIVANPQMVEKINEALAKYLSGIQKSKIEEVKALDGTGKKLKVTFTGKPMESAYGK